MYFDILQDRRHTIKRGAIAKQSRSSVLDRGRGPEFPTSAIWQTIYIDRVQLKNQLVKILQFLVSAFSF